MAGTRQLIGVRGVKTTEVGSTKFEAELDPTTGGWPQRVVEVAKGGRRFTTINAAIASITTASANKRFVIMIYPGIYNETVDMTNKPYINLLGMGGSPDAVKITASSGTVLKTTNASPCVHRNIQLAATGTAKAIEVPTGSTDIIRFRNCDITFTGVDQAVNMIQQKSGILDLAECALQYYEVHISGTTGTHRAVQIDNCLNFIMRSTLATMIVNDTSNTSEMIHEASASTGQTTVKDCLAQIQAAGGDATFYHAEAAGSEDDVDVESTVISLEGSGGTGVAYKTGNNTTTVNSTGNYISIFGFSFNYSFDVAANDTIMTHFDHMIADGEFTGTGEIRECHSDAPGELHTENIILDELLTADRDITGSAVADFLTILNAHVLIGAAGAATLDVLHVTTDEGAGPAEVAAVGTGVGVDVIRQRLGAAAALGKAWSVDSTVWTDRTTAFNSAGTDVQIFAAGNDYVYVGAAAKFDEIPIALAIPASNPGIDPIFEYWNGSAWTSFSPADNTSGFRQDGAVRFESSKLTGWATTQVNSEVDGPWYYVRIQRTRGSLGTPPTEDTIQLRAVDTEFFWDKDGNCNVKTFGMSVSIASTGSPPTSAQLTAEFGTAASVGAGFVKMLDPGGTGTAFYMIGSDGTSWWYNSFNKCP